MANPTYSTGTVSVTAGGTVVTGIGTIWSGINAKAGDSLYIGAIADPVEIKDITDVTHLTLWAPWAGSTQTSVTYTIVQDYPARVVGVAAAQDVGTMLAKLHTDGLPFLVGLTETVPDPSLGADGQYAYKPDTGAWWVKTAGVWVLSSDPANAFVQAGTGAVTRTMQDKARDIVSVKDFGAVCDGTTDDLAAIHAALAAAGTVIIPDVTCAVSGKIIIPAGKALVGLSRENSIIKTLSATAGVVSVGFFSTLSDVQISSAVTRTAGWFVSMDASDSTLYNFILADPFQGVLINDGLAEITVDRGHIGVGLNHVGIQVGTGSGSPSVALRLNDLVIISSAAARATAGIRLTNVGDLTATYVTVLQCQTNWSVAPGSGAMVVFVKCSQCWADSGVNGLQMSPTGTGFIRDFSWENGWFGSNTTLNLSANASGTNSIDGVRIVNTSVLTSPFGISVDGATISNFQILGGYVANCTNGINLNNILSGSVTGAKIGPYGALGGNGTGLIISGSTDNVVVGNNDLSGNTTAASITTSGLNISFTNNLGFSGWRSFTPTVTSGTGAITTLGAVSGSYLLTGKTVQYNVNIAITTNGTGASDLRVTNMPFASVSKNQPGAGRNNATGTMAQGYVVSGSTLLVMNKYDNTYPVASGETIMFQGFYERT